MPDFGGCAILGVSAMEGIAPLPPGVYTKLFKIQGLAEGYKGAIGVEKRGWGVCGVVWRVSLSSFTGWE